MDITITPSRMRALLTATAGQDDVRYYLRGIYVTSQRLVATDGHQLVAISPTPAHVPRMLVDDPIILGLGMIPAVGMPAEPDERQAIKALMGALRKSTADEVRLHMDGTTGEAVVLNHKGKLLARVPLHAIDARYPDIDKVIPTKAEETPHDWLWLDPRFAAAMAEALGSQGASIRPHGDTIHPVTVRYIDADDVLHIIMPLRV